MRTIRIAVTAAATALLTALPAVSAFADSGAVLTYGSADGQNVAVGDVLSATATNTTFHTTSGGTTGITCGSSAFSATVTNNPAAGGTATESVTAQTFSSCTSNIFGTTGVKSITVGGLPLSATVGGGNVTINGPITTALSLNSLLGTINCTYSAPSITGTVANTDNSITFTEQAFTKATGSGLCPANGYFSAKYAPVADSNQSNSPVFTS